MKGTHNVIACWDMGGQGWETAGEKRAGGAGGAEGGGASHGANQDLILVLYRRLEEEEVDLLDVSEWDAASTICFSYCSCCCFRGCCSCDYYDWYCYHCCWYCYNYFYDLYCNYCDYNN